MYSCWVSLAWDSVRLYQLAFVQLSLLSAVSARFARSCSAWNSNLVNLAPAWAGSELGLRCVSRACSLSIMNGPGVMLQSKSDLPSRLLLAFLYNWLSLINVLQLRQSRICEVYYFVPVTYSTTLTQLWHNFDVTLTYIWHIFEITLRQFWDYFEKTGTLNTIFVEFWQNNMVVLQGSINEE